MGHAGAIVGADGTGSAQNKEKVLSEAGAHIADTTTHIVEILKPLNIKRMKTMDKKHLCHVYYNEPYPGF